MDGIRTFSRGCGLSPCREPGRRGLPRGQAPRVRACVCVWRKLGEGRPGGRGAGLRPEGDQAPAAPARSAPRGRGGGRATAAESGCDPGVQAPSGKRGPHVPRLPRAAPRRRAGRSASGVLGQGSATPGLRAGGLWELGRRRIPGAEWMPGRAVRLQRSRGQLRGAPAGAAATQGARAQSPAWAQCVR